MRGRGNIAMLARDARRTLKGIDPGLSTRFATMQTQRCDTSWGSAHSYAVGGLRRPCQPARRRRPVRPGRYMVARRQVEIGVRQALGARRPDIIRLILGEVAWLLATGLAVGILIAIAGRFAATLLFGLVPHDPATIAIGVILLATAGAIASAWPARRACRVDPLVALREA